MAPVELRKVPAGQGTGGLTKKREISKRNLPETDPWCVFRINLLILGTDGTIVTNWTHVSSPVINTLGIAIRTKRAWQTVLSLALSLEWVVGPFPAFEWLFGLFRAEVTTWANT